MVSGNAQPEPAPLVFAKGTDVGRVRDHNEDYLDAFSPPDPAQRREKGVLFVVADGMGGHQAGDVASQSAVEMISHEYYADPDTDVRTSLIGAIKKANEFIYQEAQRTRTRAGMGTTAVAAVVRGRELYLANVGDSRAYLMRQGAVAQATRDHSFVAEQVRAGLLTREEARAHPQRNVITRALGSRPEVKVDTYNGELQSGDALLLCSDGLSEYVHEEDLLAVMSRFPPQEAVSRLIAMARERGGSDNISVLIVQAGGQAGAAPGTHAMEATQPILLQSGRRRQVPWLAAGVVAAALLGVAILVAAGVFLPGIVSRRIPTPTVLPSPPLLPTEAATPEPTPEPTAVPTSTPMTDAADAGELVLEMPDDGAVISAGTVELRWRWEGRPLRTSELFQVCVVRPDDSRDCSLTRRDASLSLEAQTEGTYEWWVEVRDLLQLAHESGHRTFSVGLLDADTGPVTTTAMMTETESAGSE